MDENAIKQVSALALGKSRTIIETFAPGGTWHGDEYEVLNPNRADNKLGSFKINMATGKWCDFAIDGEDASGGDIVSWVAYIKGCKQSEAAKEIENHTGAVPVAPLIAKQSLVPPPKQTQVPMPARIVKPPSHGQLGEASFAYEYRNGDGELLGWVCRFEGQDGGKSFRPFTAWNDENGRVKTTWKGFDKPRPLYRLPGLTNNACTVVVCEGEKTADAAAELLAGRDFVATTPMNGAKSPQFADWTQLAGRRVVIWPDNDEAGAGFAEAIAELLDGASIIDPAAFGDKPEKWDAADALDEGLDADAVVAVIESATGPVEAEFEKMTRRACAETHRRHSVITQPWRGA